MHCGIRRVDKYKAPARGSSENAVWAAEHGSYAFRDRARKSLSSPRRVGHL